MKLKSHDCIPDYFDKSSLSKHSLESYFENTLSNNNAGTCVCVGIPLIFHNLSWIILVFIYIFIIDY